MVGRSMIISGDFFSKLPSGFEDATDISSSSFTSSLMKTLDFSAFDITPLYSTFSCVLYCIGVSIPFVSCLLLVSSFRPLASGDDMIPFGSLPLFLFLLYLLMSLLEVE